MSRCAPLAALVLGLCLLAGAGSAAAQVATRDVYPERRTAFAGGVTGLADLTYSAIPGYRPMTLDLYLPKGRGPHPVVVYVHGGGWLGGTSRLAGTFDNFPALLASMAARGYVVASINYRLSGEARFPAAEQDVKSALRWLRTHADTYGIDRDRFAIWGGSAGGHLAALAATSCGVAALAPLPPPAAPGAVPAPASGPPQSDCVQSAVIWYGIFDLETTDMRPGADRPGPSPGGPAGMLLGCERSQCLPGAARAASPVTYVDPKDPPFLLIHGTEDKTVPANQSIAFDKVLKAAGVRSELVLIPGSDHSFLGPKGETQPAVNRQVMDRVNAFIDETIGPGRR